MSEYRKVDVNILDRASQGCPQAASRLYEMYSGLVYSQVFKIVKNHEEAQDIMQRTFEVAFRKIDTLKNLQIFPFWLKRIGHNEAVNAYNKNKRKATVELTKTHCENGSSDHPLDNLRNKEFEKYFKEAVNKLPEDFKETFYLAVLKKQPYKEVAESLNISLSLVKLRVYRSRLLIQKSLKPYLRGTQT